MTSVLARVIGSFLIAEKNSKEFHIGGAKEKEVKDTGFREGEVSCFSNGDDLESS